MNPIDLCIERPILTLMLMLSLLVFGVLGYRQLGVDQFPNMEFPVVTVTAQLEGAAPEVMEEDVTEVLEEHLNTIGGLRELRSNTFHGASVITAEFQLERNLDQATQDVRDKVARARWELPKELEPPVVDKINLANRPILWIPVKTDRTPVEMTEYLKYTMKPAIETIDGVASVELFGRRERAIRIWVDGDALRARGLSVQDLISAIGREHVERPGGRVESSQIEYSLKTAAEFETVDQLADLIVAHVDGADVRLRDVANVEDGAEDPRMLARFNGGVAGGLGILKQSQANTVKIADEVRKRIEEMRASLPSGMQLTEWSQIMDFSLSIRESVAETQFALIFGAVLATLVVWVFLLRIGPTLIVGAAIPISLIATFGVMWLAGATLNIMTLLALALAVGVVVDDAIVVLENVERHRERGEGPRDAASKGTKEIAFAATAATFSIAAVFLPVVFVKGLVGSFLREFGVTVAASVLFSLLVALTLTPMLAARMPAPHAKVRTGFTRHIETSLERFDAGYRRLLDWAFAHRLTVLGIAAASFGIALFLGSRLGAEFFPPSDEGRFFAMMETPPGTTLEGTLDRLGQAEKWMLAQPEVHGLFAGVGVTGPEGPGSVNNAVFVSILKPHAERRRSAMELMAAARAAFGNIPGMKTRVFDPSQFFGGSGEGELEFSLRGNLELGELDALSDRFVNALRERRGFVDLHKSLELGLPEVRVVPDREKAASLGVDAASVATVVQASIGGIDVGKFKDAGHRYDIRMRLEANERSDPSDIGRLYVRTRDGGVVELRNLTRVETGAAASKITRLDRLRAVTISANLEGIPVGEAIRQIRELGSSILPETVSIRFSGSAQAFLESAQQFALAIGLSVLVIYMLLAAQFESLLHPLTVMMALPLSMVGAAGAFFVLNALGRPGMTLNLFSLIGVILLFGLVAKNSILLVDFANQLRRQGVDKETAMRTAAPVRMRPVVMTALSMIFGVLPAAIGVGPGAESRQPMAVVTGAGMLSSTLLTLLVVPVFYLVLDDAMEWLGARVRRLRPRAGGPAGAQPPERERAA
ncbi:MAG TPA: efflux RND transporter permease subunit [Myxococcota bacterium]|nr:efflux RND transporter permease subunit [Myxococcota bacterium]